MSASLTWTDVALRLALSVLVGIVVGFNRSEHGKPAGMRTTLLVCLAASVAMIQVNLLLPTAGRSSNSFVMNDLMRLPLGILTGVGFIGGGAILRRDNITVGVTTAATLWLVTVIGLCIGGGQIVLGLAATGLCLFALWVLRWVENAFRQERRAQLSIEHRHSGGEGDSPKARERGLVEFHGSRLTQQRKDNHQELVFEINHFRRMTDTEAPAVVDALAELPGVVKLQWDELR